MDMVNACDIEAVDHHTDQSAIAQTEETGNTTISKGVGGGGAFANWLIYAVVYAAMVAGMLSQYLYDWLTKASGAKRLLAGVRSWP